MSSETLAFLLVCVVAAFPILYGFGLSASRGWHRGKREFVRDLVEQSTAKPKDKVAEARKRM